jgi:hypothetical protein
VIIFNQEAAPVPLCFYHHASTTIQPRLLLSVFLNHPLKAQSHATRLKQPCHSQKSAQAYSMAKWQQCNVPQPILLSTAQAWACQSEWHGEYRLCFFCYV